MTPMSKPEPVVTEEMIEAGRKAGRRLALSGPDLKATYLAMRSLDPTLKAGVDAGLLARVLPFLKAYQPVPPRNLIADVEAALSTQPVVSAPMRGEVERQIADIAETIARGETESQAEDDTFGETEMQVAKAIARATILAAAPGDPESVLDAMVENLAVKFLPEARAAIEALSALGDTTR